jgi:hypothetical protein
LVFFIGLCVMMQALLNALLIWKSACRSTIRQVTSIRFKSRSDKRELT